MCHRAFYLILFLGAGVAMGQSKSSAIAPGLDAAWKHYARTGIDARPGSRFPYDTCFKRSAAIHKLPLTLLLAVARGESNFNSRAVSKANALGVMQILWPGTARHLGLRRKADLFKPCTNIDAGARYLSELLTRYDGNFHQTLGAYNYGPGRIPKLLAPMPNGARWYSGYIYKHLQFVINHDMPTGDLQQKAVALNEGRQRLIVFSSSQRAKAFIESVTRVQPSLRLAWSRARLSLYTVDLLYRNKRELTTALQLLGKAGFSLANDY